MDGGRQKQKHRGHVGDYTIVRRKDAVLNSGGDQSDVTVWTDLEAILEIELMALLDCLTKG